jgi:hypothetical protein
MAEHEQDLDSREADGAEFGRLVGSTWSLEDVIRPSSERRPGVWQPIGEIAKRLRDELIAKRAAAGDRG